MRDTDFVARYGDEEFVVVMPQTSLAGASVFGDRLQSRVADDLGASVCCGVTEAHAGDDSRTLFARADSALYSAKAAGQNRLFVHTGTHIREHFAGTIATPNSGSTPSGSSSSTPYQFISDEDEGAAYDAATERESPEELAV
jgi:hypothetical protein